MKKGFLLSLIAIFSLSTLNAQDVYWPSDVSEINTGSNATYLIQSSNLDGNSIIYGYVLGAFFTNDDGNLQCAGFTNCSSGSVQLAIMGDDTTTEEKDGFYEGEEITWLAYGTFAQQTYNATVTFSEQPPFGSNTYSTNGLNIINSFNISSVVLGCMDTTACNFNANATDDDASCTYAQDNFDCEGNCIDTDGDAVCDIDEILGCTDATACNFNALATDEDDSCTAPETNFDCNGDCLNDVDNDGVCDENEILGCSDESACNFDATATDLDDSCEFTSGCESCEQSVIIANDDDNDSICNEDEILGCTDMDACNYDSAATDENNTCSYATGNCDSCSGEINGTGFVIDNDADDDGICNEDEEGACVDASACNYNSNPTFEEDNSLCVYATGNCDTCSGEDDGSGTVVDNDTDNDGICNIDEIEGCTDDAACNYNILATEENDSCVLPVGCETCSGEQDGNGTVLANDDDNDGVCNADEVGGCAISVACNYNEYATDPDNSICIYPSSFGFCSTCSDETDGTGYVIDNDLDNDGVCDEDEITGCIDTTACNYNENATEEGNCIFLDTSTECMICSGETDGTGIPVTNDDDLDGVCDDEEIFGCTDSLYTEYNPLATEYDETCITLAVFGCLDNLAFNYANQANTSNESCLYDVTVNFETSNTNATTNYSVAIDTINLFLGDSPITDGDIIGGFYINEGELFCAGFTTWTGSDFSLNLWMDDPSTEEIDGITNNSTIYWIVQQETTMFNYLVDFTLIQATGVTFVSQITLNQTTSIGCMDPTAFNYNSNAFISDGACEDFIEGCLDSDACNFNEDANTDDGSCYYITAAIPNFEAGIPLTVETDAINASYTWFLNGVEQDETTNQFTPYVNGEYMVVVTDNIGCVISATYNLENIGINEYLSNQVSLYPNPSTNFVEIQSFANKIQSLKIISITGKLIQEYTVNALQFKIERNDIAKGIYFIQATINNREVTKQVIFE